jgi:hypothetical protein
MIGTIIAMPLTIFDMKGVPGHRRERIEAVGVAGGKHACGPHEAWIAGPAALAERVRDTLAK